MLLLLFVMKVSSQVPVLSSEDGAGFIGKRGGVTTIFVHEHFSGELLGCEDKKVLLSMTYCHTLTQHIRCFIFIVCYFNARQPF